MNDNPIRAQQRADFQRRMNNLESELKDVAQINVRTIPEAIFVRDFLPLFSGEIIDTEHNLLSYWYVIAGTPYHPVNIISAAGTFVIQVPPVLDRKAISNNPSTKGSLGAVFEEAKQKAYLSPVLSERIINNELNSRFLSGNDQSTDLALVTQWNALLRHYGKGVSPVTAQTVSAVEESDFEIE